MKPIPVLDKWAAYNDVLVGEAVNHPEFENRTRVHTNKVILIDVKLGMAACTADEVWQLGRPGKLGDYVDPVSRRFF